MATHRGWCYKCQKFRAKIIELDDGTMDPQPCRRCKWNNDAATDAWLTKKPNTVIVDGVEVEGYTKDKAWRRNHVSFTDAVDRRESMKRWREQEEDDA